MAVLPVFNWEGLSVAPTNTLLTVTPTWTRLDNLGGGLRVSEITIRRGRRDEFERHSAGTMPSMNWMRFWRSAIRSIPALPIAR